MSNSITTIKPIKFDNSPQHERNIAICKLIKSGMSQTEVAKEYGFTRQRIGMIWAKYKGREEIKSTE